MTGSLAEGASDPTASRDSSLLVVAPGTLRGGSAYTFTVQVVPEDHPSAASTASLDVRTASLGVEAGSAYTACVFARS